MSAISAMVRSRVVRTLFLPVRLALQALTAVLSFLVKPQVLFSLAIIACVYPGSCCWLRPPLSADISAFSLPILGSAIADPVAFLQGERPFQPWSLGMLQLAVATAGLIAVWLLKARMSIVGGVFFAVLLGCQIALLFNYPRVIVQIAREGDLRDAVVVLLEDTTEPEIDITSFPRVKSLKRMVEPGSIESAINFVPYGGATFLMLALLALLLASRGSTPQRLFKATGWTMVGVLVFVALSWPRLTAEYHWHRAIVAEQRGDLDRAATHLEQAKQFFPNLNEVPRTWMLQGKIDYQRDKISAARQYFLARQKARNGELEQALHELEVIKEKSNWSYLASPVMVNRWMGDMTTTQAMEDFTQGRMEASDQRWDQAMKLDSSIIYRPLCLAALRSRWMGANPKAVIELVDPLLDRLADRSLKAALHAMVGDCFFAAGEFSVARKHYQTSLDIFSLPKTINYRALRGLLGW